MLLYFIDLSIILIIAKLAIISIRRLCRRENLLSPLLYFQVHHHIVYVCLMHTPH